MINKFITGAVSLALALSIAGCDSKGGKKGGEAEVRQPALAVETMTLAVSDLNEGVDVVGTLSPKLEADVKSEYLGIVDEVYVMEWVRVKKGTPLARLNTREVETGINKLQAGVEIARANLLEAEVAAARAQREAERSMKLKEYGLITQQNLEDAETGTAASLARVRAAKAQLKAAEEDSRQGETRLSKALIRSPMEGVISLRSISVGDLVGEVGTPKVMFRIVDNRLLDLTVSVPSHETAVVKVGQALVFSTDALPGRTFMGQVKFINPAVSELDRSVKVTAEVPNTPEVLKGGLFVQGKIITSQRRGVLQAPVTALTSWDLGGKKGELFVAEGGVAHLRKVNTGLVSGDKVEIRDGLPPGAQIIVRGAFSLKDGDQVRINGKKEGN